MRPAWSRYIWTRIQRAQYPLIKDTLNHNGLRPLEIKVYYLFRVTRLVRIGDHDHHHHHRRRCRRSRRRQDRGRSKQQHCPLMVPAGCTKTCPLSNSFKSYLGQTRLPLWRPCTAERRHVSSCSPRTGEVFRTSSHSPNPTPSA